MTDFHVVDKFETQLHTVKPVGKGNAFVLTDGVLEEMQAQLRYISHL